MHCGGQDLPHTLEVFVIVVEHHHGNGQDAQYDQPQTIARIAKCALVAIGCAELHAVVLSCSARS